MKSELGPKNSLLGVPSMKSEPGPKNSLLGNPDEGAEVARQAAMLLRVSRSESTAANFCARWALDC